MCCRWTLGTCASGACQAAASKCGFSRAPVSQVQSLRRRCWVSGQPPSPSGGRSRTRGSLHVGARLAMRPGTSSMSWPRPPPRWPQTARQRLQPQRRWRCAKLRPARPEERQPGLWSGASGPGSPRSCLRRPSSNSQRPGWSCCTQRCRLPRIQRKWRPRPRPSSTGQRPATWLQKWRLRPRPQRLPSRLLGTCRPQMWPSKPRPRRRRTRPRRPRLPSGPPGPWPATRH
mmetsp:Transcript_88664/g.275931  ORF Transcript_88664/g.275931 Transcript_88664/m.275931 type:complete len:230 (+) Transcript_88664:1121-1810(+)